jgi:hypothetical protein
VDLGLDSVTARVKSVPPIVWVAVVGVVILYLVVLRGKGSGSGQIVGAGSTVGGGGGSSGGSTPDTSTNPASTQDIAGLAQIFTDSTAALQQEIVALETQAAQQNAANATWQKGVLDAINGLKGTGNPGVPNPSPSPSPIPTPAPAVVSGLWRLTSGQVNYLSQQGSGLDAHQLHLLHLNQPITTLTARQVHLLHAYKTTR